MPQAPRHIDTRTFKKTTKRRPFFPHRSQIRIEPRLRNENPSLLHGQQGPFFHVGATLLLCGGHGRRIHVDDTPFNSFNRKGCPSLRPLQHPNLPLSLLIPRETNSTTLKVPRTRHTTGVGVGRYANKR